jgi:hypothetical protein
MRRARQLHMDRFLEVTAIPRDREVAGFNPEGLHRMAPGKRYKFFLDDLVPPKNAIATAGAIACSTSVAPTP